MDESCNRMCRLTSALCNSRQIWNKDKCRCECKEDLVNKMVIRDIFGIQIIVLVNAINYAV